MTARATSKLYTPDVLALTTALAAFPLVDALPLRAEARSRTCGSSIALGLALDAQGLVSEVGMTVSACAIGQASAALLAQSVTGRAPGHITRTAEALEDWLAGGDELPDWPGIAALAAARDHPGRHGALLLPWKAACEALSQGVAAR
jgi:NifU-like protein involved in Fe-S cluster formation